MPQERRSAPKVAHSPSTVPESVEGQIRAAFPDAPIMVAIARAESRFNPSAANPASSARGVFQILIGTWHDHGCTGDRLNAADNIKCARKIYDRSGTVPWNSSRAMW